MSDFLAILYLLTAAGLSLYGFLGLLTLGLYWRHRHDTFPLPAVSAAQLPPVTVQLPIFNERFVVKRLVDAVTDLHYPPDRLQIQILDDSTDDTTAIAAQLVADYRQQGVDINLLHREHRQGFKAGALSAGLPSATGDYIVVFDADFAPQPDFLLQTVPHFLHEPRLGMVQVRWSHLNAEDSSLTAVQAIALDKHFAMEQTVRHRADLYPKFNGAGGIWRRSCLEDAGGWQADTVCEDLCLSTRAILRGWDFRFLNEVTAPAELPAVISAYKNQQARWAKGSTQCLVKFGRSILVDRGHPVLARLYALLAMSAYTTHLLLITLLLLQIPLAAMGYRHSSFLLLFSVAGIGQPLLFVLAQQTLYPDWRRRLRHFPAMLLIAVGLAPSNTRAILQALFGRQHPFIRTPKLGQRPFAAVDAYRLPFDWIVLVELFLALYAALGILLLIWQGEPGPLLFLLTCLLGLGYVVWLSFREVPQIAPTAIRPWLDGHNDA